jgi:hypothetical protein
MPGGKFTDSLITENLKVATEYFKATAANKSNKNSGGFIGFIPFKMNFTMDGISGIKIYNELNVDTSFLPQGYNNTTKFIVTGVDHKLNKNDWETTIHTTLVPTTSKISKITGSFKVSLKEEVTPVTPDPLIPPSNNNSPIISGGAGNYITPAREGVIGDYIDIAKTLSSSTLKKLASKNGGQYPIQFFTDPSGNNPGKTFAKIESKVGRRNAYKSNPEFDKFLVPWKYKSSSGFEKKATVNKNWIPTLNEMAAFLDSKGMWNAQHIVDWSPGILRRDVTPSSGIVYGQISGHAFGMAIDINYSFYPLGSTGAANYRNNITKSANTQEYKTANVLKVLNENFVERQGGTEKVFWQFPKDTHHFSVFVSV